MHDNTLTNHEPPARTCTPAATRHRAWTHTLARTGLLAWTLIGVLALADVAGAEGPDQTAAPESSTATPVADGAAAQAAAASAHEQGATPVTALTTTKAAPLARAVTSARVSAPSRGYPSTAAARAAAGGNALAATATTRTAAGAEGRGVRQRPDFVFGRPGFSLGIRGLWRQARAESDLYDFVTHELTLEKSDFNAPGIAFDVGFALTSRLELLAGVDFSRSSARSQDREYPVDTEGIPIEQDTELSQFGATGSLAFALAPRGRSVGQYAWIPARVVPYVGVGGGLVRYEFVQFGDWVDFVDLAVFTETFATKGWGLGGHVLGGVDIRLARQVLLTAEVRRVWAQAEVFGSFFGEFDPIDLGGLHIGVGVRFVF